MKIGEGSHGGKNSFRKLSYPGKVVLNNFKGSWLMEKVYLRISIHLFICSLIKLLLNTFREANAGVKGMGHAIQEAR